MNPGIDEYINNDCYFIIFVLINLKCLNMDLCSYQTNAILDDLFRVKKDNSKSASTSRKRNDTLKRTQQSNDDLVPPYDQVDRDQGIFVKMSKTPKTSNKKENNKPNNKE